MFQANMCSSSGGQLYEYNFWHNHSVLVGVWYAVQDGAGYLPEFLKMQCLKNIKFYKANSK